MIRPGRGANAAFVTTNTFFATKADKNGLFFTGVELLFAEINEEVDPRQLEALDAAGAGLLTRIRFGLIPQVLPNYASYSLLRLEGNVAAAGALGIVGAGGIGLELQRAITYTEFSTYLAILLLLVSVIFVIDLTSEAIRHRLILSQDREP